MKRPFSEALRELVGAVQPAGIGDELIRVDSVYFDLPIEVALRRKGEETEFLGDLPKWRWRTVFDPPPGRMRVRCYLGDAL